VVGFCVMTPFIRGINSGLALLWRQWVMAPVEHPLQKMTQAHPAPIDWVIGLTAAVVTAPILEELLFRGILQPWCVSRRYGGDLAVAGAVGVAAFYTTPNVAHAGDARGALIAGAPLLFALAMVPVYLVLRNRYRSATVNGLFGTALLFGVAHAAVWPTPVALTVLGVGLGLLYHRTQSVVPPTVAHALFNGLSFIQLVISKTSHPHEG
jgi:membrane protease YdiL (CAAX protease family)